MKYQDFKRICDSEDIGNLLGIFYFPKANINVSSGVVKKHHYLKNNTEFDKILEQWKQSKENKQ